MLVEEAIGQEVIDQEEIDEGNRSQFNSIN